MITQVAILKDGQVFVGADGERHHHLLNYRTHPIGFLKSGKQGFIDDKGNFCTRSEAALHALSCGQIKKPVKRLFSEDLW